MSDQIELDFSDVKDFAPVARNVPKGNYLLRVEKIDVDKSKAGNPMWIVDSSFVDGAFAGQQIREYLTLTEKALFKVKSWLEAVLGQPIPKKKMKLPNTAADLNKRFSGKIFGAHIDDGDPYVNNNGEEVTKSEIQYHLMAKDVQRGQTAQSAEETVTASTPTEEKPAAEPETETAAEEPSGDVADQLESFDLDSL